VAGQEDNSNRIAVVNADGYLVDPETGLVLSSEPPVDATVRFHGYDDFMRRAFNHPIGPAGVPGTGELPRQARSILEIRNHVRTIAWQVGVPGWVVDSAVDIARRFMSRRGRGNGDNRGNGGNYTLREIAAACLLLAAREGGWPLEVKRNISVFGRPSRILSAAYSVASAVGIDPRSPPTVRQLISSIASRNGFPAHVARRALELWEKLLEVEPRYPQGKNPVPIAGALLYLAGVELEGQRGAFSSVKRFTETTGVPPGTTANRVREIRARLNGRSIRRDRSKSKVD